MTVHYFPNGLAISGESGERVKALVPQAGWCMFGGEPTAVLPHTLKTARLLKNLGFEVDSPITNDPGWRWSGRFQPYDHQKVTSGFLTLHDRAFVFNDMGTGKTASAIWAAEYLRRKGEISSVLIVSPLSTLRSVWQDELFNVAPSATVQVLHGAKNRQARVDRLNIPADYYIINHDGIKSISKELIAAKKIGLIIVDEASAYKNHMSARFAAMRDIARGRKLWLMTGSPMAQSPVDAYGLAKLVCPQNIPKTMKAFRDQVMHQITDYKWVPKKGAIEAVFAALQPAVRFSKSECIDLPPVTFMDRYADLTLDQATAIQEFIDEEAATVGGVEITAANAAVKINKLLQIAQGAVRDNDGDVQTMEAAPRLQTVADLVAESASKTLVFAPYTASIDMLRAFLDRAFPGQVDYIDGRVSANVRASLVRTFQDPASPLRVLVCHPKTAAHGLTLTEASTTIWYGPVFSAEQYEQANARTDRPGQKRNVSIYNVFSTTQERDVFTALRSKQMNQGMLLDMYRRTIQRTGA